MGMAILRRVGAALVSLLVLLVLVFGLVRMTGDPVYFVLPPEATQEQKDRARRELGLDQPVVVQFVRYVIGVTQGDLGNSFRARVPVTSLIAQRIPATLTMTAGALLLMVLVGIPLGIYSAYWRGGLLDRFARFVAAIGQSMPSFWLGLLLILLFAVNLRIVPSGGYGGLEHLILPSVTLSFGAIAGLVRLLRSSMIESLSSDYVTFHRIKGLSERAVLWRHALRNAGLTTLSFLGVVTAGLLTGSVLVETVFVWPGVGRLMIEGVERRDFTVVQGVLLVFGAVYIAVNLLVDVLYMLLNPRLR
jgi:peptide/nickel transport system permease protein